MLCVKASCARSSLRRGRPAPAGGPSSAEERNEGQVVELQRVRRGDPGIDDPEGGHHQQESEVEHGPLLAPPLETANNKEAKVKR